MSDSMDVSFTGGELEATGNSSGPNKHQMLVKDERWRLWMYFTPEMARQWISVLTPIAGSGDGHVV